MKYYITETYMIRNISLKKNYLTLAIKEPNYQTQLNIFKKYVILFKNYYKKINL